MSKQQQQPGARQLELAQYEAEQAKKRFASSLGALQYRLKPGTLANSAWTGVRDKGSEVADDALHAVNDLADGAVRAVKERPVAASGVAAALLLIVIRLLVGLRVDEAGEHAGLDMAQHREKLGD